MSEFTDAIQELWNKIKELFGEAESLAVSASKTFIQTIASGGGALLVDAAEAAVKAAETTGGTNSEKLSAALVAVEGTIINAGIPFVENAARLAIENAVAKMKQDSTAQVPAV